MVYLLASAAIVMLDEERLLSLLLLLPTMILSVLTNPELNRVFLEEYKNAALLEDDDDDEQEEEEEEKKVRESCAARVKEFNEEASISSKR
jgi:hypothetical protein